MDKIYRLVFQGINRVTNVTNQIDRSLEKTLGQTGETGQGFDDMGGQIFAATFKANLAILALELSFKAVSATIGAFSKQLGSAADQQNSMAIAAINLSDVLGGISIDKSTSIIDNLDTGIAKATAPLPGTTRSYIDLANALTDKVIPAAIDASGALDTAKFESDSLKISRLFGVLGNAANSSSTEIISAAQKALSGSLTMGEMNQLDLFTRTPLKRTIEAELKVYGANQLKDLTEQQRVELFGKISDKLLNDQALTKLSSTFSGKVEGIMTTLFDDTVGIFGFNRKLIARGNMRVIDGATSVLNEVSDIFEVLGKVFADSGITGDTPGEFIYDRLQDFADFLDTMESMIEKYSGLLSSIVKVGSFVFTRLGDVLKIIFNVIGTFIDAIAETIEFFSPITNAVVGYLGGVLDSFILFLSGIADLLAGFLHYDLGKFGEGLDKIGTSLFVGGNVDEFERKRTTQAGLAQSPLNQISTSSSGGALGALSRLSGTRFNGQIPQTVLDFSRTEANFSGNARQVIANENEYILRPEQLKNLITNIQNSASQVFNINVQTMTEQQFADMIVHTIKTEWTNTTLANG